MKISRRTFVSFDELCPYQCKHCYTYGIVRDNFRTIEEIVESISKDDFDVIYVSQKNDNFSNPLRGIDLCHRLFKRYRTNLFIITRNVFNDDELKELDKLKEYLNQANKQLFIAISLNALESINVCESAGKVCSPNSRIDFIKKLSDRGYTPILMLRPIFPDNIIPVEECLRIIDLAHKHVSCIVSSGLGVNDDILERLGMKESDFSYNQSQEYLQGAIDCEIKFIDVTTEMEKIRKKCHSLNVAFFEHSMPALNYIMDSLDSK